MKHSLWIYFFVLCAMVLFGCASDDDSDPNKDASPEPGSETSNPDVINPDQHVEDPGNSDDPTGQDVEVIDHTADWLGPLDPEAALEYMKETYSQGLVIINVVPEEYKQDEAFTGSIYIPYTELEARKDEIPAEKPVILHCNRGRASALAYPILEECRKDIPVLSYIDGEPLYDEFNAWVEEQNASSD